MDSKSINLKRLNDAVDSMDSMESMDHGIQGFHGIHGFHGFHDTWQHLNGIAGAMNLASAVSFLLVWYAEAWQLAQRCWRSQ